MVDEPGDKVTCMETHRVRVLVEWDAEDEPWVTHVLALGHGASLNQLRYRLRCILMS